MATVQFITLTGSVKSADPVPNTDGTQATQTSGSTTLLEGADLNNFGSKVNGSTDTFTKGTSSAETKSAAQLKTELDELKATRDTNYVNIDKIEREITALITSAETKIKDAVKEQKEKVGEHEEAVEQAANQELQKYVAANKDGDGMTKDELSANIKNALPNMPDFSFVDTIVSSVSSIINTIKSKIVDLNILISATQIIEDEIPVKQAAYEAALKAEQSDEDGGSTSISIDDIDTNAETIQTYSNVASAASLIQNFGYVNGGTGSTYYQNNGLTLNSTLAAAKQSSDNANGSVSVISGNNENLSSQKDLSVDSVETASESIPAETVSNTEDFPEKTEETADTNEEPTYSYNSKGEVISIDKDGNTTKVESPYKDMKPEIDSNGKLIFVHKEDEIEEN